MASTLCLREMLISTADLGELIPVNFVSENRCLQLLAFPRRSREDQWSNRRPAHAEEVFL